MRRRRTEPQPLSALVAKVYPAEEPEQLEAIRAFRWWERAVPPRVAENARPVRLRGGVLTIHVTSSTWAQELSYLREQLLASIRRGARQTKIKDLNIRVRPIPPSGRPRPPVAAPLEERLRPVELPDELARVLACIDDNALREAIADAATTSLAVSSTDRNRKTRKIVGGEPPPK
jgi:hypothetical protein